MAGSSSYQIAITSTLRAAHRASCSARADELLSLSAQPGYEQLDNQATDGREAGVLLSTRPSLMRLCLNASFLSFSQGLDVVQSVTILRGLVLLYSASG